MTNDLLNRLKINYFCCTRPGFFSRIANAYSDVSEVLKDSESVISAKLKISPGTSAKFLKETSGFDAGKDLQALRDNGVEIILNGAADFPKELLSIPEPPSLLYVKGNVGLTGEKFAVVGTRLPTSYGKRMAVKFARELCALGFNIVSGLARGIDSIAHQTAVSVKGKTTAVVGTGLANCYPSENRKLADDIINCGGAVISEYPMFFGPEKYHFPIRNRLIAGLSRAVLVCQGAEKSGSLITARLACEQGKEVFAVPGEGDCVQSKGPNALIKTGACVAENIDDIINNLSDEVLSALGVGRGNFSASCAEGGNSRKISALTDEEKLVYSCLDDGDCAVDDFAEKTKLPVSRVSAVLFELEIKSLVAFDSGKYSKT